MDTPDELAFLERLGIEPLDSSPEEGFWSYALTDSAKTEVLLSFNTHEGSIQTVVKRDGDELATVSHEEMERLLLDEQGQTIRAEGGRGKSRIEMLIRVEPKLSVHWSSVGVGE